MALSRRLYTTVFFLLLLFSALPGYAQKQASISFEKVEGDGLTNHYIKCIQQDGIGYLWFGTEEGLFRYDGYSFQAFKSFPGKTGSLVNDNIETLYPEKEQWLWVGSRGGLSRINLQTADVTNYSPSEAVMVYAIVPKSDSVFWIGTASGLFQFNTKTACWTRMQVLNKDVFIRCIAADRQNNLFIATHNGFYWYHTLTNECEHYLLPLPEEKDKPLQIVHRTYLDSEGMLWLTTWNAGLVRFNPTNKTFSRWFHKGDDLHRLPFKTAFDLLQDEDGSFWIANSDAGLTLFQPQTAAFSNYPVDWDNEKNLSDKTYSLFRDKTGIYWLGTENGIFKYDPHIAHLSSREFYWKMGDRLVRTHLSPLCLLKEKAGLWWFGTYEGLFLLHEQTGILEEYTTELHLPRFTPVSNLERDDSGAIWVTARNKLIRCQVTGGKSLHLKSTLFDSPALQSSISVLYTDLHHRKWIGTHHNGIFLFDSSAKTFSPYPATTVNEIRCLYENSKDRLLVGTEHAGLQVLQPGSGKYESIHLDNPSVAKDLTINAIFKLGGWWWLGTEENGLIRCDEQFKNSKVYTSEDGLPSKKITSIVADQRLHLWLLTEGGVVDFSPVTQQMKVYGKEEGLRNPAYLWAMVEDENHCMKIGDMGYLHECNPAQQKRNNTPPAVLITAFKIFDKDYPVNAVQPVALSYDQNDFSFEFLALSYTRPQANQYAYMLEGLDKQWTNAGTRRYASYANLSEGRYVFKVKACNNEGVWNKTPATLVLLIKPPFWHRWWFYALVIVITAAIAYGFYSVKINQLKARQQLRNKIARDLHDDIGSTLSGITIFSKMALQKMRNHPADSTELLQKISDRSEKTMDALSDIVWSINTRNDDIQHFEAKVQEYLSEHLEPLGISFEFVVAEDMKAVRLDMETRKELYLILKEAVHNICKYAGSTHVLVSLKKEKGTGVLLVSDNGKGFDLARPTNGNGLRNMQHRAEKIGAAISVRSREESGTEIQVRFHIP
jgi:ligand-binding sensor domain-containing protein/two-component sensor histidine kinase